MKILPLVRAEFPQNLVANFQSYKKNSNIAACDPSLKKNSLKNLDRHSVYGKREQKDFEMVFIL